MRSNGLATILLLIPILAVPAIAIFGIPQFTPVTDSFLSEFDDNLRSARPNQSPKHVAEEAFGELDGFGAESDSNDDPVPQRLESVAADQTRQKKGTRRQVSPAGFEWDEDSNSEQLNSPQRSRLNAPSITREFEEAASESPESQKTVIIDKSSRQARRQKQSKKSDTYAHPLSPDRDVIKDSSLVQAGAEESVDDQKTNNKTKSKRLSPNSPRAANEGRLTWKTAVERLHELDIRNFRIEPGRDSDQFVFICHAPGDSPRTTIRFEAEADNPLKALEKVIEQIVERRQQRQ